MRCDTLVMRFGHGLIGRRVDTPPLGVYPGGIATIVKVEPDPAAPEVVFEVSLPGYGSMGMFCGELVRMVDLFGLPPNELVHIEEVLYATEKHWQAVLKVLSRKQLSSEDGDLLLDVGQGLNISILKLKSVIGNIWRTNIRDPDAPN